MESIFRRLRGGSPAAGRVSCESAITVLTELGIANDPGQLLTLDAKLLAETLIKVSPRDIGDRHGIDNTTIGIVNDHAQTGAVLADTPLRVLEFGRHRDVDILFSTATNEADWWVINATEEFDPGSIGNLVDELVAKSRISRSRARRIVAAYDVNGRTPVEVRGALITDFFFTLPAARAALAHAAAGGNAYLLSVGPAEGAHAVHGTEMYGIVGQPRPGRTDEQAIRDSFVRDVLLDFAAGRHDRLWSAVTTEPTSHGIGNPAYDPTTHAAEVMPTFAGIERT